MIQIYIEVNKQWDGYKEGRPEINQDVIRRLIVDIHAERLLNLEELSKD